MVNTKTLAPADFLALVGWSIEHKDLIQPAIADVEELVAPGASLDDRCTAARQLIDLVQKAGSDFPLHAAKHADVADPTTDPAVSDDRKAALQARAEALGIDWNGLTTFLETLGGIAITILQGLGVLPKSSE